MGLYACTSCGTVNIDSRDECPSCGNDEYEVVNTGGISSASTSASTATADEAEAEDEGEADEGDEE